MIAAGLVGHFETDLGVGKVGESIVATYLRHNGYAVLPAYERSLADKGPQLFLPDFTSLAVPDILAIKAGRTHWAEVKYKSAPIWYHSQQEWRTGTDYTYFLRYLTVARSTPFPVWLYFLYKGGFIENAGRESPSGLYAASVEDLAKAIAYFNPNSGNGGMVLWRLDSLQKYASLETLERVSQQYHEKKISSLR